MKPIFCVVTFFGLILLKPFIALGQEQSLPADVGLSAEIIISRGPENDAANIQQALDALPLSGGTVHLRAGTYLLNQGIRISRSNVTLLGETGTILRLAPHVEQPVILIGTDVQNPTEEDIIRNVSVGYMEIDGNMENQKSETDPARNWIRNNGIDVRAVAYLWIKNVNVHHARSGGIVVSWFSRKINIADSAFHDNYFDGIALYDSKDIFISNFFSFANLGAGLSFDNNLHSVMLIGGKVSRNNVGIFVRSADDISFHNILVSGNRRYGSYLDMARRLFFQGCGFYDNGGYGIWLASTAPGSITAVVGCFFSGNGGACIRDDSRGGLAQASNICQDLTSPASASPARAVRPCGMPVQKSSSGIDAAMAVPFPGAASIRNLPLQISTRSFMLCRPYPTTPDLSASTSSR